MYITQLIWDEYTHENRLCLIILPQLYPEAIVQYILVRVQHIMRSTFAVKSQRKTDATVDRDELLNYAWERSFLEEYDVQEGGGKSSVVWTRDKAGGDKGKLRSRFRRSASFQIPIPPCNCDKSESGTLIEFI